MADIPAKRQIIELHQPVAGQSVMKIEVDIVEGCSICETWNDDSGNQYLTPGPCATLKLLAQPFAEHPDFDRSWLPTTP